MSHFELFGNNKSPAPAQTVIHKIITDNDEPFSELHTICSAEIGQWPMFVCLFSKSFVG